MPDQIDLEPAHYREKGRRPVRRISDRYMRFAAVGCGIWAASWLYAFRHFIEGDTPWTAAAIIFAPSAALLVYMLATEKA
jgi:hypothetical protein